MPKKSPTSFRSRKLGRSNCARRAKRPPTKVVPVGEHLFHAMAETAPAAIYIYHLKREPHFCYANAAAERLTGYSRKELLKMNAVDVIHPDSREFIRKVMAARIAGKPVPPSYEAKVLTKDGHERWGAFNTSVIDYQGGPAVLGIGFDITQRKEAEEAVRLSHQRYRAIMKQAADAIFLQDRPERFAEVNEAASRLLGYSEAELLQLDPRDLYTDEDRAATSQRMARMRRGEILVRERELRHKDGRWLKVESTGQVLDDGRFLTVVRDISERKRAEAERERLIDELQEAVGKVNTLSGLLPMCASCKKIRDDRGHWNSIEAYISERSQADFTHGICPECAKRLYPEDYKK